MSKRNKGARNRARANRLAALRAELALVMEDKLQPHHLAYNHEQTARLIEQFQWRKEVPLWAQKYVRLGRIERGIGDDHLDAFSYALDTAMVTGTGVVRLTSTG